jgi:hypothetical protein
MKKIIELFNFLTIGAFLSTAVLFVGDLFGFSLGLNFHLLWRVLAGILALTVLLNTGNIKKLLKISNTSKKFLLLSGLNLFLFALFLLFYPIFRFGSPFVWEDRIANFKAAKRIEITLNEPLNQSFQAKSNNLGTIGLRIISEDVVTEEETEEATTGAELTENEETGAVQGINIEEGELDEELDEELYLGEPERIVFRIKEEEEKDYFYENTYELNQYWENNYFLFGFPIQYESQDKKYVFEIEKTKEGETNKVFLIEENSQGNFNFYPRYVYNLASLKTDWEPILLNISRKTTQFLEEKTNQFNLIFVFLLIEFLILVFLKKEQEKFKEKLNFYLKYGFLIGLFLITISSLKFEFIQNIDYLQNVINNLLKYSFPLASLTIAFGFLIFYFNREKIEKKAIKGKDTEGLLEKRRLQEFPKKFPGINKIPILRNFIRLCYKEGWFYSITLIAVCFLFLIFGTYHLGQFMSVDESKWVNVRVPQLYDALLKMDFGRTFINDKPGVLPAFLSGFVNFFLDHNFYKNNPLIYEQYLFWWRLPIVIFNFLMLFLIYFFTKKLLNKQYSILITGLIALNPILIGISQVVNPDATLWSVGFLSFLTFFLYLKTNEDKYTWYSGIFFGLALISKYFISIFYIFFFFVVYFEYLFRIINRKQFFQRCLDLGKVYLISIFVYTLLFPATWINPVQIIKGTIGANILNPGAFLFLIFLFIILLESIVFEGRFIKIIRQKIDIEKFLLIYFCISFLIFFGFLSLNLFLNYSFFNPDILNRLYFANSDKLFFANLMFSAYTIFFSLTYVLLFALLISPLFFAIKKGKSFKMESLVAVSIFILILLFIIGSSLGGFIVNARYQIILYPLYCLLSAIFFIRLIKSLRFRLFIIFLLLSFSFFVTHRTAPFYLHYTNGLNIHNSVITEAWGFGGYELAQKINQLPEAENIVVWSDREGFNEFFIGKSYWRGADDPFNYGIDYLTLTKGGENIALKAYKYNKGKSYLYKILDFYKEQPEFIFCINNNPNDCIRAVRLK